MSKVNDVKDTDDVRIVEDAENNANSKTSLLKQKRKNQKNLKDPLLVQTVSLHEDIYALTWNSFRKEVWEDKKVHGVPISLSHWDHFKIIVHFLFFFIIVILTVSILVYESFLSDSYNDAEWPIIILRLTLVAFAQKKLEPEIYQGLALFRYSSKHEDEFFHPCFAKFVAICQFFMAAFTFIAIFLFVCMANEALELIMNFAGLAVISELDDWVGEQIVSESIHIEEKPYEHAQLIKENLNERMGIFCKMCLIAEDMEIDDDQNEQSGCITWLANHIPWILLPLLTLPCEWILLKIQKEIIGVEGKTEAHKAE
jgi:hypothetical protein